MDTTGKDKRACVVELSVFSGSDGALSTDEAAAALDTHVDTIPDAVLTAIEAVDVGATCKREHLQRTGSSGSDLLDMFFYRANWRLVVKDCYRSGCGGRAWALWAGSPSLANLASAASAALQVLGTPHSEASSLAALFFGASRDAATVTAAADPSTCNSSASPSACLPRVLPRVLDTAHSGAHQHQHASTRGAGMGSV